MMMKISDRVFGEGRPVTVTCLHDDDSGHNKL